MFFERKKRKKENANELITQFVIKKITSARKFMDGNVHTCVVNIFKNS